MRPFIIRWLCTTLAVGVAVKLTGMRVDSFGALAGMAFLLGILNALVRPFVLRLTLPFIIVTMGFFILLINALMLGLAGSVIPGFHVGGFWNAFFGALIVSFVSWVLSLFFRTSTGEYHLITHHPGERLKRVEGRVVE